MKINREKLKNVIHEVFREHLNECESLITERWSYSDDMDNAIDHVYDIVTSCIRTGNIKLNKIDYGVGLYSGSSKISLFGIDDITLNFYLYECPDDEVCRYIISNAFSENDYDEDKKVLTITVFTVLGSLIEEVSNKNVSHELEHILQISKGHSGNAKYDSLMNSAYRAASEIIYSKGNNNNDFDVIVAWLIYYSNPHEQDSFMNEYYQDLRSMRQLIQNKNSETHRRYYDYYKKCDIVKKYQSNQDFLNILQKYRIYGYTLRNFNIMIDKGIKRFAKKMKNVEKHFTTVVKNANESHYRLAPVTNGSLRRIF